MLFGFVFMEKHAKNKKKRGAFQNLLHHISTMGAPQNIIQPDSETTVKGYNFRFLTIFGNWSCDHHPNILLDGP